MQSETAGRPCIALATLTSAPGRHVRLLDALRTYADAVADESATLTFALFTDLQRPDTVVAFEIYADQAALDAHSVSDARERLNECLPELMTGQQLHWLQPLAGHGLPVPLPG